MLGFRKFMVVVVFASVNHCVGSQACECGRVPQDRIIGGESASVQDYPWMGVILSIHSNSIDVCGATLISPRFAITAYHCTTTFSSNVVFAVGISDLSKTSSTTQRTNIQKAIQYHPGIFHSRFDDIALIELEKPVQYGRYVQPICLPPKNKDFSGVNAVYLGYGAPKDEKNTISPQLQKGQAKVPTRSQCSNALRTLGGVLGAKQICAGTYGGAPATCYGDSGGPLMYYDAQKGVWELIGVTVSTYSCSSPKGYGIFTGVSYYIDWIQENSDNTACQK